VGFFTINSVLYTKFKTMDIKEEIFNFISTHEAQVSRDVKKKDDDIEVRFTTFGNRAGCRAVHDVIQMLDDDMKIKVVEMMRNKRVL
jgi:predicted regulator of amino acid metabolism with ACT domain